MLCEQDCDETAIENGKDSATSPLKGLLAFSMMSL